MHKSKAMKKSFDQVVSDIDSLLDEGIGTPAKLANARGAMVRVVGSKYYRPAPNEPDPGPSMEVLRSLLHGLKVEKHHASTH